MLSQKLTNTKQYKDFIKVLNSEQGIGDPYAIQAMMVLMLMEIVESLDAIMETIANHE